MPQILTEQDESNKQLTVAVVHVRGAFIGTAPKGKHLLCMSVVLLPLSSNTFSTSVQCCWCIVQMIRTVIGHKSPLSGFTKFEVTHFAVEMCNGML